MGDERKPRRRSRIAALAAQVRELRDEVAQLRAAQQARCTHPAWQPMWWQPNKIWCGGAAGGNTVLNVPGTETIGSSTTCVQPAGYTSTFTVGL